MNNTPTTLSIDDDGDDEIFGAAPADTQNSFSAPAREEGESDESYHSRYQAWWDDREELADAFYS